LSFTLPPQMSGLASHVGLQFFGYNATVYIDAVNWS
jgi:hypothetical protein